MRGRVTRHGVADRTVTIPTRKPIGSKLHVVGCAWQRTGSPGGRSLAGADVCRPALFVLRRRQLFQPRLTAGNRLLVELLQEGNTPAAARAGAPALGKLTGHLRP